MLLLWGICWNITTCQNDQEGKDNLLGDLKNEMLDAAEIEVKSGQIEWLGIIIDADTDISARWRAIRNRLSGSGYSNVPEIPSPTGTIIAAVPNRPKVGVWLMPNNVLPGMLEDLVSYFVPPKDRLWARAVRTVNAIPATQQRFVENQRTKAHTHTWLVWQEKPGIPMGTAINNRYVKPETVQAHSLVGWVRQLFDLA